MPDKFSPEVRSRIMASIRQKDTKLEINFLKLLSAELYPKGYRYRKHCGQLPGKPDIVFLKKKVAVFVDGDFWHGYNLTKLGKKLPNSYWQQKIKNNMARDKRVNRELKKLGWRVLRLWEHEIEKNPEKIINKIKRVLTGQ